MNLKVRFTPDNRRPSMAFEAPDQSRIRSVLDRPGKPGDDSFDCCDAAASPRTKTPPYAFSVSKNRTGSPLDGVVNSPCHITRLPRTKVPTGQPVTRTPS